MNFFGPNHKVNPAVEQTPPSESPPVMDKKRFSVKAWLLCAFVGLLMLTPIALFVFFFSGLMVGEEFSPDDFTRRRFSYNVVPVINYTFQGIEYVDSTPVLEKTLVADGLIPTPAGGVTAPRTWHLISDSKTPVELSNDFDAGILCQYLDLKNREGENVWVVWNSKHPKLAAEFWPVVQKLAQNDVYWAIPPIMRQALALEKESDPVFSDTLSRTAARGYIEAARECQSEGDHARAIRLFSFAIGHEPGPAAFRGRAESYRQTGDLDKSRADEQQADLHD